MKKVQNIDCIDFMKQFQDKYFDCAVVDPPYNVGTGGGRFGNGKARNMQVYNTYANHDKTPGKEYFTELFRVSKKQIIWGANYYPEFLQRSGAIFWDKERKNDLLSHGEIAFQNFDNKVYKITQKWNGFMRGHEIKKRIHPNQKPINLYRKIYQMFCTPDMKILDTHLGSGSSRIAAHMEGLEFYAAELDEYYFKKQENRFTEFLQEQQLF